jgi:tetratricopeptide (TPR) repeat protein
LRNPRDARVLARYAALAVPLAPEPARGPAQRVARARELLQRIARRDALPGDPRALPEPEIERAITLHTALAEALLEHDESSFALVYAAGRQQDAGTVLCLRQIAALAVARDRLELAEQALALARQYFLQDLAVSAELGHVLLARGRGEAALRVFGERYAIEPGQLEARRDLAYALASEGRPGEALALLAADRSACERELGCALEAARIALEAGRPEEAVRYAAKRLAVDAGDLDALFVTADAQTRAGQLDEARRTYERALAVRPDSVRARTALAQLPASNDSAH